MGCGLGATAKGLVRRVRNEGSIGGQIRGSRSGDFFFFAVGADCMELCVCSRCRVVEDVIGDGVVEDVIGDGDDGRGNYGSRLERLASRHA